MKKKILSIVLAICMVLTLVPTTAFAAFTQTYVVAGSSELCGKNWDGDSTSSPDNVMTDNGDGAYQKVYTDVAVMDGYQFKVVENNVTGVQTWYGIDGGDKNFTFNVKSVCDVTITFDPATLKITVTGDGVEIPTTLNVESMRAVGNGNGNWLNGVSWNPADDKNLMREVSPKVYEITYTDLDEFVDYQVKFVANGSWDDVWGGVYQGSGIESDAVYNSSNNITIEVPYELADVTLRLDLTNFDYATKTGAKFTVTVVDKASTSSETTEPSVSAYATKAQLMDDTFAPDSSTGEAENYGKLVFGKNSSGTAQEWYILGKDNGVSGDNTIIFAASPIATNQVFEDVWLNNKNESSLWSDCDYSGVSITEVYPNHYGASDLRVALKTMATNTSYFTTAEQGLMNATTVKTKDTNNSSVTYTTTDKLYALAADGSGTSTIKAGTSDSTVLAMNSYWSNGSWFWLRSPDDPYGGGALFASPGNSVSVSHVFSDYAVHPASNLNLSSVLFSSAAAANPSMDGPSYGTIAPDKAMALRMDGSSMDIGTVEYDPQTNTIKAQKGNISGKVALVVQGKNIVQKQDEIGETDWFFSVRVDGEYSINTDVIKAAFGFSSVNFEKCKIWLETVGTDRMIYAVNGVKKIQTVDITDIETPTVNTALDTSALCATQGVSSTAPSVTWTPNDSAAKYNKSYTAGVTLSAAEGYEFSDSTTATVNGNPATSVTKNLDGTLTVTYKFSAIPDTIAPTGKISIDTNSWEDFFSGITFDLFFKESQEVKITADDNSGDAVKIEYLLSDNELNLAQLNSATFTIYNGAFNINPDNEYVIYARLTDSSNNVKYINSNGIVLDATAPVITGVENGKTYCEEQAVTVTDKYLDSVTLNGTSISLNTSNQFTLSAADSEQKIIATDKAGNKTEVIVTVKNGHTDTDNDNVCDDCGLNLHKHTGGEANCISKAVCEVCDESYGDLDPENHTGNTEIRGAKEPTCTEDGYTGDTYCLDCGALIFLGDVIPKLSHTDEDDDHICDICGENVSNHIDNDDDGICDICSADIDADSKTENENTSKKSPQTGNDNETALLLAFLLSCGGVIVVTSSYSKRKKHSAE